jgi:hypothetical protein
MAAAMTFGIAPIIMCDHRPPLFSVVVIRFQERATRVQGAIDA